MPITSEEKLILQSREREEIKENHHQNKVYKDIYTRENNSYFYDQKNVIPENAYLSSYMTLPVKKKPPKKYSVSDILPENNIEENITPYESIDLREFLTESNISVFFTK